MIVINLEERVDRWTKISDQFRSLGIEIERFNAVRHDIGWIGCGLSHQECVRNAINEPWLLVLEDDCEITDAFSANFHHLLEVLSSDIQGWELLNGGPTMPNRDPARPFILRERLFYVHGFALHFALYNRWGYSKVLCWNPWRHRQIDVYYHELGKLPTPSFRTIASVDHLAVQYSSLSDIENRNVDYTMLFRQSNDMLRLAESNYIRAGSRVRYLPARHLHWSGTLVISCETDYIFHEAGGFSGRYHLDGLRLIVDWADYGREEFVNVDDAWVYRRILL